MLSDKDGQREADDAIARRLGLLPDSRDDSHDDTPATNEPPDMSDCVEALVPREPCHHDTRILQCPYCGHELDEVDPPYCFVCKEYKIVPERYCVECEEVIP